MSTAWRVRTLMLDGKLVYRVERNTPGIPSQRTSLNPPWFLIRDCPDKETAKKIMNGEED